MTYKAIAIEKMLSGDTSGRLRLLHDQLVALGLKTKMPSNSSTLLFEAINPMKQRIGLVALRDASTGVFSFPSTYWGRRTQEVERALSSIDRSQLVATEGGFSSSQYSACQVSISTCTIEQLELVVAGLISTHVRAISGNA